MHTHYEKKITKDYLVCFILLSFLALYGFYKNGLSYYFNKDLSFFMALKPLLLSLSGLISGIIVDLIINHKLDKNYLLGFLISLSLPISLSPIISFIVIFIILFSLAKFKITISPLFITTLLLTYLVKANYSNDIEMKMPVFYQTLDVFLGKSIGGVGITSIVLMLISLIVLCTRFYYKKEIPFVTLVTYGILTTIFSITNKDSNLFLNLLNSSVIYVAIFYLPFNDYSPIKYNYQIIYSFTAGLLIFLATFFINNLTGAFIGGLIANILFYLIEILSKKKKFIAS